MSIKFRLDCRYDVFILRLFQSAPQPVPDFRSTQNFLICIEMFLAAGTRSLLRTDFKHFPSVIPLSLYLQLHTTMSSPSLTFGHLTESRQVGRSYPLSFSSSFNLAHAAWLCFMWISRAIFPIPIALLPPSYCSLDTYAPT